MRPWLIFVFALLLPIAGARFVVLDVIGGAFLVLTASIGWYAVKGGMDITWLLCLAIVLFLNAVFDAFILIARVMRTESPIFGHKLPWQTNLVHALLLLGPVVELAGASLCWSVYREHLANIVLDDQFEHIVPERRDPYGSMETNRPGPGRMLVAPAQTELGGGNLQLSSTSKAQGID
eukprot:CAMPEP_0172657942 /NCGR_PEP_ID=MMETSP1074-20121228/2445_1 /TAXON_ID=2916 /ORGANISM="Ceratium fusus, Strain PA161109" /LENGTH=177 /DNA_ID=CAMNT_0013473147 /DNA_START=144 /DNA_END=678 /DNA_ORIENTATION=+